MKFQLIACIVFTLKENQAVSNFHRQPTHGHVSHLLRNQQRSRNTYQKTFHEFETINPLKSESEIETGYGYGGGWTNSGEEDEGLPFLDMIESDRVVKFINEFLGVMGPFLFPLPYVLALIPFAIPALPLSIWLDMRRGEGEGHHNKPGEGEGTPSDSHQNENNKTTSIGHPSMSISGGFMSGDITNTTTTTLRPGPISNPLVQMPMAENPLISTDNSSFTQTATIITDGNGTIHTNSSTSTGNPPPFPIFNMSGVGAPPDFPLPPTLFPFPLFLNSSFLGEDYDIEI